MMWPFSKQEPENPICYRDDCMGSLWHPAGEHIIVDRSNFLPCPHKCGIHDFPDEKELAAHIEWWHLAETLAYVNPEAL